MNKIQLVLVWVGGIALSVFLFLKQETSYIVAGAAVIVFLIVITARAIKGGGESSGAPQGYIQPSVEPAEVSGAYPVIKVPGRFFGGNMIFKKEGMQFRDRMYYYKNITGIFYNTVNLVVHGIPSSQTYAYGIRSTDGKIDISFASVFYIGNKKLQDIYYQLILLSKQFVEPGIVGRMIKDIFERGNTVKIGGVHFTKKGYYKKKLFGGIKEVLWGDRVYVPQMNEGYVFVYKDKNEKAEKFSTLSMQTENAVVLPELVQGCYDKFNNIS